MKFFVIFAAAALSVAFVSSDGESCLFLFQFLKYENKVKKRDKNDAI